MSTWRIETEENYPRHQGAIDYWIGTMFRDGVPETTLTGFSEDHVVNRLKKHRDEILGKERAHRNLKTIIIQDTDKDF